MGTIKGLIRSRRNFWGKGVMNIANVVVGVIVIGSFISTNLSTRDKIWNIALGMAAYFILVYFAMKLRKEDEA